MVSAIEKLIGSSYMLGLIHAEEENPERKINAADETEIPEIPFNEAMQFLKSKVPMSKAEWKSLEPKLRFRAFTVAQLGSAEVVDKAKQILLKSFEKGGGTYSDTWEELKKKVNVNALGIKPGYWENVFRTNTQSAYIAGKLQQYENTGVAAYQLMVIEDGRTSKICRHLLTASGYGMIISADHPFWKKYGFPPYHFQCRTSIRAIWPSQVGKLGNMVENPTMKSLSKFKVQEGFGGNPLKRGTWWQMTDSMWEQAKKYGVLKKIREFYKSSVGKKVFAFDVYIPKEKFTKYLLSPTSPVGKHKAKLFKATLGYTIDNWEDLVDNILEHFDVSKLVEIGTIDEGIKYNHIMNLTGPNRNTSSVKTTWILRPGTNTYQLVTAIVLKEV